MIQAVKEDSIDNELDELSRIYDLRNQLNQALPSFELCTSLWGDLMSKLLHAAWHRTNRGESW